MSRDDKRIGRNIRAIRNANKKDYLEFAGDIGISESLLQKIESGGKPATDQIIQIIADISGFSFNSIKYKDLSYLEKGELYFDEDLTFAELTEVDEFKETILTLLKFHFPIIEDEKALEDDEFKAGIDIAYRKIQTCIFTPTECVAAINHFIHSSNNENCADFSAINILSCFGYLYNATVLSLLSDDKISIPLNKKRISSLSDYFREVNAVVKNSTNQDKIRKAKKDYLSKYNGLLTKYMRKLVESKENADYAYYFLCLRYSIGLMDEEITLLDEHQMRIFGESMFDSLWKMGNKYAVALNDYLNIE